jgi:hypothetical protein
MENSIRMWWKHKAVISKCEASQKKFTRPKKGQFLEIDDAVLRVFQERCKTGINYIVLMTHTVALSFFQNPVLHHESNPCPIPIHI